MESNCCRVYSFDPFTEYKTNLEKKYEKVNRKQFWIKHTSNLNKIILTGSQIAQLNNRIKSFMFATNNISDNLTASNVKEKINIMFEYLFRTEKFFTNGAPVGNKFFKQIISEFNIANIEKTVKNNIYAVTIKRAYIRTLPTDKKILDYRLLSYFNRNIETITHINELVKILNISRDKKWYFIVCNYSFGWIKSKDVKILKKRKDYNRINKKFCIILKDNVTSNNLKLGDILPYINKKIVLPNGKAIRVSNFQKDDYSIGYLPFTKQNVISLVFNILKTPYGWGGQGNRRDCSLFIMDIFRCFGIKLPRNSSKQSEVLIGFDISKAKNREQFIIENALPLTSLIYKKGHIMLYMGKIKNKPYIVHDFNMLHYHRGEILITDFDFGRKGFKDSLKKLIYLNYTSFKLYYPLKSEKSQYKFR